MVWIHPKGKTYHLLGSAFPKFTAVNPGSGIDVPSHCIVEYGKPDQYKAVGIATLLSRRL